MKTRRKESKRDTPGPSHKGYIARLDELERDPRSLIVDSKASWHDGISRTDATNLDFETLPGPKDRELGIYISRPTEVPEGVDVAALIQQTQRREYSMPMYRKPDTRRTVIGGAADPEKNEVQGVSLKDFTKDDVLHLLSELKRALRTVDQLAQFHPSSEVWPLAIRTLADVAFLVLRQEPSSSALQEPFRQLWGRNHLFTSRWEELVHSGLVKKETIIRDDTLLVLHNATRTVHHIWLQRSNDVARLLTDPHARTEFLKCQRLCMEQPVEVDPDGLRWDRFAVLVRAFLLSTPGFMEAGPYRHSLRDMNRVDWFACDHLERFEKTVMRPYLMDGGKDSLWEREVKPSLKSTKKFPSEHAKTMRGALARQYVEKHRL